MVAVASMYGASLQPRLCSTRRRPAITRPNATHFSTQITSIPYFKELQQQLTTRLGEVSDAISGASQRLLDAFVDTTFTFSHQPLRPTESNFAPVDEIGESIEIMEIEGTIPADFPEGVYIRNENDFIGYDEDCDE